MIPNRRRRPLLRVLVFTALSLAVLVAALLAWMFLQLPPRGADRIPIGEDVVGVWAAQSYAWIVRTPHGAVLIDAGGESDAASLERELATLGRTPEQVHAILVTHGHKDHWSGAAAFPNAEVLVGPGEHAVLTGSHLLKSPAGRVTRVLLPQPKLPGRIRELKDGEELSIDTLTFHAIHVPGHTPGSTMYLFGELLFTGDSLLPRGDEVMAPPGFLSESDAEVHASLKKVSALDFDRIADGHAGTTDDAKRKLEALLTSGAPPSSP